MHRSRPAGRTTAGERPGGISRAVALICSAILLVAAAAPARVAAAGTCVGDCNTNGTVATDDLVRLVHIALGHGVSTQCPSGDTNNNQRITVDEILKALNAGRLGCGGTPGEASSGLVLSAAALTAPNIVDFGLAGAFGGGGGVGATVTETAAGLQSSMQDRGGGADTRACQISGFVDTFCFFDTNSFYTLSANFIGCQFLDQFGRLTELDGVLEQNPAAVNPFTFFCTFDLVPQLQTLRLYESLTISAQSVSEFSQNVANLTETILTDGTQGCLGPNGSTTMDGTQLATVNTASTSQATFSQLHNLRVRVLSQNIEAPPGNTTCALVTGLNGNVDVANVVQSGDEVLVDQQFSETFGNSANDFFVGTAAFGTSIVRLQNGQVTTSCLGTLKFATQRLLVFNPGAACPSDGAVAVTLPDQSVNTISFTAAGGVNIDTNGDGQPDAQFTSCQEASFNLCVE